VGEKMTDFGKFIGIGTVVCFISLIVLMFVLAFALPKDSDANKMNPFSKAKTYLEEGDNTGKAVDIGVRVMVPVALIGTVIIPAVIRSKRSERRQNHD
jgi:hypothetical protein